MEEVGKKMEPLGTVLAVRLRLMQLGWNSLSAWGEAHGYPRGSVRAAVLTWGQRTDKTPHGGIARAVMRDLRTTLELGLTPEQPQPAHITAQPAAPAQQGAAA
jgi:hypothetical protein